MKKFYELLKLISRRADLLLHHVAGEDIALLAFALLVHFLPWGWALAAADLAAIAALILKEVYDYFHPDTHSVELVDIQSGVLGIIWINLMIVAIFAFG